MKRNLNKKNLLSFADDLYKEENGFIHYRPLCSGRLARKNGEITCCLLGEMYEFFTGKPVFKDSVKGFSIVKNETQIIKELAARAYFSLKPSFKDLDDFSEELENLPRINDSAGKKENIIYFLFKSKRLTKKELKRELEEVYIKRAKTCAKELKALADIYLY